jgi:hypothetical protein
LVSVALQKGSREVYDASTISVTPLGWTEHEGGTLTAETSDEIRVLILRTEHGWWSAAVAHKQTGIFINGAVRFKDREQAMSALPPLVNKVRAKLASSGHTDRL